MNHTITLVLIGFALAGCDKKEPTVTVDSAVASAPMAAPAAPSALAAAPPVVNVDTLPVEEDFEAEAEKEVTPASMNAQLDALDKELSAP